MEKGNLVGRCGNLRLKVPVEGCYFKYTKSVVTKGSRTDYPDTYFYGVLTGNEKGMVLEYKGSERILKILILSHTLRQVTLCYPDPYGGSGLMFYKKVPKQYMETLNKLTPDRIADLWRYGFKHDRLGTDPEVFIVDAKGQVVSAYNLFPSKAECSTGPFWDGFQVEFTTPSKTCLAYLTDEVQAGLRSVYNKLPAGTKLTYKSVVDIPRKMLETGDEDEVRFGCAPSMNVYGDEGFVVSNYRDISIRTSGCHFHFGTNKDPVRGVRRMDRIAGVVMTAILGELQDPRRRVLYGRAGEYRTPTHGLEWRVMGSEVLVHPAMFHLAFDLARAALELGVVGDLWETSDDETRSAINNYDFALCRKIVSRNKEMLQAICGAVYEKDKSANRAILVLVEQGVKGFIDTDMHKNWLLKGEGKWTTHSSATDCQYVRFADSLTKYRGIKQTPVQVGV